MNKIQISNMFGWIFLLLGLWQHPLIFVADAIFFVTLIACLVWAYHEHKRAKRRNATITGWMISGGGGGGGYAGPYTSATTNLTPTWYWQQNQANPVSLEKEDQEEE